jgi:hypothetical protein
MAKVTTASAWTRATAEEGVTADAEKLAPKAAIRKVERQRRLH